MCAPDMLHPFQLGSRLTINARTNISSSSSVPLGRNSVDACLNCSCTQGALRTGDARDADGFLGHQMTNERESVKCSPGPISQPIHLTLQTPSRSNGLIGEEKRLRSYPSANLWNPKLKAGVTEVHWGVQIKEPFLTLSDSQALQINGATGLLLQADMGRDKWHCG